jgi:hypothetical protein
VESIVAGETTVLAPLRSKTIEDAKVGFVDTPPVTGQHDSSVEVSSIQLFEICPRKYFLSGDQPSKKEGFDFMLAVEDVVLYGQIDHWFEEDGELIVVGDHAFEVRIYALALERYLGRLPDRALLRGEPPIEISLSLNDLKVAKNTVREFLNAHNMSLFPLQEGEHCRRCAFFRGLCPAGKT